ncbi:MAG: hypothetical protein ACREM2_09685, partial [Vulcanimicrobiaceae bacterium]
NRPAESRHLAPAPVVPGPERDVLAAFAEEPALLAEFAERIPPELFREPRARALYELLCAHARELRTEADLAALVAPDAESVAYLAAIRRPDRSASERFAEPESRRALLEGVLARLEDERIDREWRTLNAHIDELSAAGGRPPEGELEEWRRLTALRDRRRAQRLASR